MVIAKLTVERRDGAPIDAPLVLDGDGLTLKRIEIDGIAARRRRLSRRRRTSWSSPTPPAARRFQLTHRDRDRAVDSNQALMGLYRSSGVYCTQCEAEGFRRITYFLDRPGHPVRLHGPHRGRRQAKRRCCLSNGNPVEAGELPGGRHFAVWHDPFPKPSYLFALVAGDLGVREGQLRHHVRPQGRARHLCRARQGARAPPMRWTR